MEPDPDCRTVDRRGWLPRLALVLLLALPAFGTAAQAPSADEETALIQTRVEALGVGGVMLLPEVKLSLNQAVGQFYQQHGFTPAWSQDAQVDALLEALHELSLDGLDPQDYQVSKIESARSALAGPAAQRADFDVLATQSYLLALTHLYRGKVDPRSFDPGRNFDARQLDPTQGLQVALAAVNDNDVAAAFSRARPQHALYRGLREAMGGLRDVAARGGWAQIPDGPTLKPGLSDPRVPLLRRRLVDGGYLPSDLGADALDSPLYDPQLTAAVSRYQTEQYLTADGAIGPATRTALNVPVQARIDQLRVNEERARWLLHEVQNKLVVVDIAGYMLHYFDGGPDTVPERSEVGAGGAATPAIADATKPQAPTPVPTPSQPEVAGGPDTVPERSEVGAGGAATPAIADPATTLQPPAPAPTPSQSGIAGGTGTAPERGAADAAGAQSQAPNEDSEMPVWSTRVQVGKPYRMTPVFKSAIDEITFNPAWVVPPTIYSKDILPKVRANRGYLAANRLHVFDAQWRELSPQSIDWNKPPPGLRLRQEAGAGGALGRIKISFPNPYAVYLHDTPHPELFDRESRAFSSGCIRVQEPYALAVRLFDDPVRWNRAAIDQTVAAGATRTFKLANPVPVLLAYWTVDLHEGNRPAFKPDIYGLDSALLKALNRPPR